MKEIPRLLCLFVLIVGLFPIEGYGQDDTDFADFTSLIPKDEKRFRGPANAVCKIYWTENGTNFTASGVLVNNTNKDGKLYILTAAHNLPSDVNGKPKSKQVIGPFFEV
jgi:hypothetical protein